VFLLLGVAHVIPFIVCVACAKLDCMMGLRFVPFTWLIVAELRELLCFGCGFAAR
jgi:hypothetical protein